MKNLYLTLLFSLPFALAAQNVAWNPFPHGQETYWLQEDSLVRVYYNDVMIGDTAYFGAEYLLFSCLPEYIYYESEFYNYIEEYNNSQNFVDSTIILYRDSLENGSFYHQLPRPFPIEKFIHNFGVWENEEGTLLFDSQAELGDSWFIPSSHADFDSLQIRMDSIDNHSWLKISDSIIFQSVTDSVKWFSLQAFNNGLAVDSDFNNKKIMLSKNYGFIEFIRFESLLNGECDLMVMEGMLKPEDYVYGFVMSDYDFYKNLKVGDKRRWQTNEQYEDIFQYYYSMEDSIITIVDDGTNLNIERAFYVNGEMNSETFIQYSKWERNWQNQYMNDCIEKSFKAPNEIGFMETIFDLTILKKRIMDGKAYYLLENNETNFNSFPIFPSYPLSSSYEYMYCSFPQHEAGGHFKMNSQFGAIEGGCFWHGESKSYKLSCFFRNSELIYGNCTTVDIPTIFLNQNIKIQPTLVDDFLNIERNSSNISTNIKIYNTLGQIIDAAELGKGQTQIRLNTVHWYTGPYLVILEAEGRVYAEKVIKAH